MNKNLFSELLGAKNLTIDERGTGLLAAALLITACSANPEQMAGAASPPASPALGLSAAPPPAESAECRELPPALTSYDAIESGVRFSLVMTRDASGNWMPAKPLDMALHHASTIQWRDSRLLDAHASGPIVAVATGLERVSLVHEERRHLWFATYAARVDRVCPLRSKP